MSPALPVTSMMPDDLADLLGHIEWADCLVWAAASALPPTAREDERLRELLSHVHAVQWAYLQLWRGDPVAIREAADFPDLAEIGSWGRAYYQELGEVLDTLDPEALERPVTFPWAEELVRDHGRVHPTSVRRSILQIVSHSAYHRGQINTRIRHLGGEPPLVDFVAWIWSGRPPAPWNGEVGR